MKFIFFLLFAIAFQLSAFSQEYVVDPQYLISVEANQAVRMSAEQAHNQYLGKIKSNIEDVNTNAGSVVLAQEMIYNGLANVNSALKDGLEVKYMATITADIISYLQQCLALAKGEPYLLLFASGMESEMQQRSLILISDVSGYVLKQGSNVLADYNGRDELLKKVTQQLQIIDSLAYGAWRAMFWAKERGIIASVDPFQDYINKDKNFVSQIILNAKYLHQ
jgi:hypothetical protein